MKQLLINILIYTIIIAGVYTKELMGVDYLSNLGTALAWLLVVVGVIGLFLPPEKLHRTENTLINRIITRILCYSSCIFMIVMGWIVTGVCLLLVSALLYAKRVEYKKGLNNVSK